MANYRAAIMVEKPPRWLVAGRVMIIAQSIAMTVFMVLGAASLAHSVVLHRETVWLILDVAHRPVLAGWVAGTAALCVAVATLRHKIGLDRPVRRLHVYRQGRAADVAAEAHQGQLSA